MAEPDRAPSARALHPGCIVAGHLAIVAAAAVGRWPGLDPASLWHDDLWVGVYLRLSSLAELYTGPVPTPPVFLHALALAQALHPDPEWPLQVLPFVAGLAVGPAVGLAAARLTGSAALGLVAASLTALDPGMALYSVFVKQYTLGALFTAALLLAFLRGLDAPSTGTASTLTVVAIAGLGFSFSSVFPALVVVHVLALTRVLAADDARGRAGAATPAIAFDLAVALWYLALVAGRTNDVLVDDWKAKFVPLGPPAETAAFLVERGGSVLVGAMPAGLGWGVGLAALGLVSLALTPGRRLVALAALGLYSGLTVASALHFYPMGVLRLDLFTHPVTVCLAIAGVHAFTSRLPRGRALEVALAALAVAVATFRPAPAAYFPVDDAVAVAALVEAASDDDAIVLSARGALLTGYYGPWDAHIVPNDDALPVFEVHLDRPRTVSLPRLDGNGTRAVLDAFLDREATDPLYFLVYRAPRRFRRDHMIAGIEARGYRGEVIATARKSKLYRFSRSPGPGPASPVAPAAGP